MKERCIVFFFFKQKTAYEMLRSLVGSEMCIRDRFPTIQGREEAFSEGHFAAMLVICAIFTRFSGGGSFGTIGAFFVIRGERL